MLRVTFFQLSEEATVPASRVIVRDIAYRGFRTAGEFAAGTLDGTALSGNGVVLAGPLGVRDDTDLHTGTTATYDFGTWTSPFVFPGFAATEVIPSWTADTPAGCWAQVELRGSTAGDARTAWFTLARWTAAEAGISRSSVPAQSGPDGTVAADILVAAAGRALTAWQLRVTLLRPAGTAATPVLRSAGAVASRLPQPDAAVPSPPQTARGVQLDVPRYSQKIHTGHYPQWAGGGESWCSPASTAMVLAFWGVGPSPAEYAWVDPDHADPWVDHAARHCYDHAFRGTGNWPFNTAYAGRYGLDAFVTRLRSLVEAELFIAAGIPLIVSASYTKDQIPGLDYDTAGHLMVLVGFTASGDPVLNDPAAPTNDAVRKPVPRAAFETAWLGSSRGLVYVIRPPDVPLPPRPPQPNW